MLECSSPVVTSKPGRVIMGFRRSCKVVLETVGKSFIFMFEHEF